MVWKKVPQENKQANNTPECGNSGKRSVEASK